MWSGAPDAAFVRRLLQQAHALFPVFPQPYVSLLGSTSLGTAAAPDVMRTLSELTECTAYMDETAKAAALAVRGSEAHITDPSHPALRSIVSKVWRRSCASVCWHIGLYRLNRALTVFIASLCAADWRRGELGDRRSAAKTC